MRRKEVRRALGDLRRLEEHPGQAKKMKFDDDAPPKLRLNTSLATDPALRPATVAALTIQPDNKSSPNATSPLPPALQKGSYRIFQFYIRIIVPDDLSCLLMLPSHVYNKETYFSHNIREIIHTADGG